MGPRVRENPDKAQLIITSSSFADRLYFASLCWWPLFSLFSGASLSFLLALLFARYSPFYSCLFLFSFAFLSLYSAYFSVLSNFLARFSRLALHLLLLAFLGRSASFFPAYFHSNPFLLRLKSFSIASIVALRVDLKLQNTENYRSTTTSTIWFPAQNASCKLFACAPSHLPAHLKPSCNA